MPNETADTIIAIRRNLDSAIISLFVTLTLLKSLINEIKMIWNEPMNVNPNMNFKNHISIQLLLYFLPFPQVH